MCSKNKDLQHHIRSNTHKIAIKQHVSHKTTTQDKHLEIRHIYTSQDYGEKETNEKTKRTNKPRKDIIETCKMKKTHRDWETSVVPNPLRMAIFDILIMCAQPPRYTYM